MSLYDMEPGKNGKALQEELDKEAQESYFDFPAVNYDDQRFIDPDGRPWGKPIGRQSFPWHYRSQQSPSREPTTPVQNWSRRFTVKPMSTELPQEVIDDITAIVAGNKPVDRSVTGSIPGPSDWDFENLNQPNYQQTTLFTIEGLGDKVAGLGDFLADLGARAWGMVFPGRREEEERREARAYQRRLISPPPPPQKRKRIPARPTGPHLASQAMHKALAIMAERYGVSKEEVREDAGRDRNTARELQQTAQEVLREMQANWKASRRDSERRARAVQAEINSVSKPAARDPRQVMNRLGQMIVRLMKENNVPVNRRNIRQLADIASRQWVADKTNKMREQKGIAARAQRAEVAAAQAQRHIQRMWRRR